MVSVITIFLNEEHFLAEAIGSVLAQDCTDLELILVDDGSSDGSSDIARRYAACHEGLITYLEHEGHRNKGMSASRNLGLSRARGEFVAFPEGAASSAPAYSRAANGSRVAAARSVTVLAKWPVHAGVR